MGLLNRLNTLVKADAHGVVDAVEDRSLMLRQHVREAEAELHRKQARMAALEAEQKELEQEIPRLEEKISSLEEDISLAMGQEKEELARFAIKRLLPLKRRNQAVRQRLGEARQEQDDLMENLTQQQTEFENLRARVRGYLAQAGSSSELGEVFADPIVEEEEIELELLRRRRQGKKGAS